VDGLGEDAPELPPLATPEGNRKALMLRSRMAQLAHAQHYAAKKMALMQALVETWLSAAALDEGAAASGGGGGGGGGASS
jgi:hypothetical protein